MPSATEKLTPFVDYEALDQPILLLTVVSVNRSQKLSAQTD